MKKQKINWENIGLAVGAVFVSVLMSPLAIFFYKAWREMLNDAIDWMPK